MKDEYLTSYRRATLRVASAILTGIASALLLEIPLADSALILTYNVFLCILNTIVAIQVERYLHEE